MSVHRCVNAYKYSSDFQVKVQVLLKDCKLHSTICNKGFALHPLNKFKANSPKSFFLLLL